MKRSTPKLNTSKLKASFVVFIPNKSRDLETVCDDTTENYLRLLGKCLCVTFHCISKCISSLLFVEPSTRCSGGSNPIICCYKLAFRNELSE